jgi:uncharacterized protein (DUF433 family)
MAVQTAYTFLAPRPRSHYRPLWVKGRHLRADVLYRLTVGAESRTPEEVAQDCELPVAAVYEAIEYARHHQGLLEAERAQEMTRWQHLGLDRPPAVPADHPTLA